MKSWLVAALLLTAGCGGPPAYSPPAPVSQPPSAQVTAPAAVRPQLPKITGDELAKRVRANLELPYERITYQIDLVDSRGSVEKRQAIFHLASNLDGRDGSYVVFTRPPEIDGFGLLTMRPAKGNPDQFLYVPAAKKVSRILYFSTNRRSSFCGTQLTFEDLEPLNLDDFHFQVVGSDVHESVPCYLLESKPKYRFSGYSKILNWVSAQTSLVMRAVYHDPKGDLLKIASSSEPFQVGPSNWRLKRSVIRNEQNGQATHLTLIGYRAHAGKLTEEEKAIFTLKTLSLGKE